MTLRASTVLNICLQNETMTGVSMTEGPLVEWKMQVDDAAKTDENTQSPGHLHVRQFLQGNGWPEGQAVPHAEVPNKGLGPMQWWRLMRKYLTPIQRSQVH